MPIYEHVCESCNHEWEDLFSLSDPIPECPECGSDKKVKRVMSLTANGRVDEPLNRETIAKLKKEGKALAKKARHNENLRANIVGEEKYHKQQLKK
jgi:putative FmdB family regulatory protein